MVIKINASQEFNKILTSKNAEQLNHVPLTLSENMVLCKSADSLLSSCKMMENIDTDATVSVSVTCPVGETWRICAVSVYNAAQDITGIEIVLRVKRADTGVNSFFRWTIQTSLTAGVTLTSTSMGSSGVVLNAGDAVSLVGTAAAPSSTYLQVIAMVSPAGFATQ